MSATWPVRPADQVLGPEVEVAQRSGQGLADLAETLPAGVHELHGRAQPGREVLPDHGVLPDVVIVEQLERGGLLRAVRAQEALGQPRHRRQLAPEQERGLRPAQRRRGRPVARDRPGLARLAVGPLQQQRRVGVADVRGQAGGRGDAAAGVGGGQAGLVGQRLPLPVRPPVRVQVPRGPVRVPRRLAGAAAGRCVLEHGPLPAAGADPPHAGTEPRLCGSSSATAPAGSTPSRCSSSPGVGIIPAIVSPAVVAEGQAGGADVLPAVPGVDGGAPLARQRGQDRQPVFPLPARRGPGRRP